MVGVAATKDDRLEFRFLCSVNNPCLTERHWLWGRRFKVGRIPGAFAFLNLPPLFQLLGCLMRFFASVCGYHRRVEMPF